MFGKDLDFYIITVSYLNYDSSFAQPNKRPPHIVPFRTDKPSSKNNSRYLPTSESQRAPYTKVRITNAQTIDFRCPRIVRWLSFGDLRFVFYFSFLKCEDDEGPGKFFGGRNVSFYEMIYRWDLN
jgi:hypothetical protein